MLFRAKKKKKRHGSYHGDTQWSTKPYREAGSTMSATFNHVKAYRINAAQPSDQWKWSVISDPVWLQRTNRTDIGNGLSQIILHWASLFLSVLESLHMTQKSSLRAVYLCLRRIGPRQSKTICILQRGKFLWSILLPLFGNGKETRSHLQLLWGTINKDVHYSAMTMPLHRLRSHSPRVVCF